MYQPIKTNQMKKTRWQLQDARNRLSELLRKAREEAPQTITPHGNDAAVVVDAHECEWECLSQTQKLRGLPHVGRSSV
jgi:prevent-host-death family protein